MEMTLVLVGPQLYVTNSKILFRQIKHSMDIYMLISNDNIFRKELKDEASTCDDYSSKIQELENKLHKVSEIFVQLVY